MKIEIRFFGKLLPLCLCILFIVLSGCRKDLTEETDITKYAWNLKSVKSGNNTSDPPTEYLLEFTNDSIFCMGLSVNVGKGKYKIETKGKIIVYGYQPCTEKCCETEFDYKLIAAFKNVTTYELKLNGNRLIFKGTDGEVEFKKE